MGTRPAIEVGGSYIVKGTYKLAAADEGVLTFWETAKVNRAPSETIGVDARALALARGRLDRGDGVVLAGDAREGDIVLVMSNGSFNEIHQKLLNCLATDTGD